MLKGIFELEKDWKDYTEDEQKEIVAKKAKVLLHLVETNPRLEEALIGLKQEYIASVERKAKEYILGGFPTLSKMNNKTQKEK